MTNPAQENVVAPYLTHRFEVVMTVSGSPSGVKNPVCNAAFAECNGLDMTMEVKTYRSGGHNTKQFQRVGAVTYGRLTLRRGMTDTLHLWRWFEVALTPGQNVKAAGTITLLDSTGEPKLRFVLSGCLPVKVTGPSLNAKNSDIAMEELQLVYETLKLETEGGGASGGLGIGASAGLSVSGGAGISASANVSASAKLSLG